MSDIIKKQDSKDMAEILEQEEKEKQIRWKVHVKWIIGNLVFIAIVLLSFIVTNKVMCGKALLESLNSFSTILSIILSVSSIAFAGYTSMETGRHFHFMTRAIEEIRVTNQIMSENYKILIEHYHDTVKSIPQLLNKNFEKQNRKNGNIFELTKGISNDSENENQD